MKSICVIASHPIQYQSPIFRELAHVADLTVCFAHQYTPKDQAREGFGIEFEWDRNLTAGYSCLFLKNRAKQPSFSRFFGCNTPEISTHIKNNKYDAVLLMGWNLLSYWQAVIACKLSKVPVLVRGDSTLQTSRSRLIKLLKAVPYRLMFGLFDRCLYVGNLSKKYFEYYGVNETKLVFAPHSVDNQWFQTQASQLGKKDTRRKYGIDNEAFVVLFVGKIVSGKRPHDLIDAVDGMKTKCIMVFVGSGDAVGELKDRAQLLGVDARFLGFKNQSELPECYCMADVLVLPSASETWGLVVNEGMACGLPAIVSDAVGCAGDLIEEGITGYIYPMGDTEALRNKLNKVVEQWVPSFRSDAVVQKVSEYSPVQTSLGILKACESLSNEYRNS